MAKLSVAGFWDSKANLEALVDRPCQQDRLYVGAPDFDSVRTRAARLVHRCGTEGKCQEFQSQVKVDRADTTEGVSQRRALGPQNIRKIAQSSHAICEDQSQSSDLLWDSLAFKHVWHEVGRARQQESSGLSPQHEGNSQPHDGERR